MGNTCTDGITQLKNIKFAGGKGEKEDPIFDFRYRDDKYLDESGISQKSGNLAPFENHMKSLTQDPFHDPYFDVEYSELFKVHHAIEKESPQKGFYKAPSFEDKPSGMEQAVKEVEEEHRPKTETQVGEMNPLSKNAQITYDQAPPFKKPFDAEHDFNPVYGPYKDENGETYTGQYRFGKRWGVGVGIDTRGELYHGQWDRGLKEGYARVIKPNGDIYEGEYKEGQFNGHGKMIIFESGVITEGEFRYGVPNGICDEKYPDGSRYEGMMVNGIKEGNGKFTFVDNSVYVGIFKDDFANGEGKTFKKNLKFFSEKLIYFFRGIHKN